MIARTGSTGGTPLLVCCCGRAAVAAFLLLLLSRSRRSVVGVHMWSMWVPQGLGALRPNNVCVGQYKL